MNHKRYFHIDFLRAVAIISVIVVHTLQYNLKDSLTRFIWNYSHFVVPALIFCSGYVLEKHQYSFDKLSRVFSWWKKRLIRLLLPFYLYLTFHFLLLIIFPAFFSGLGLIKSPAYIIKSALLIGGIDANWLPLLFIEMTLLFPALKLIIKRPFILVFYILLALFMTVFYTSRTASGISLYQNYRLLMILPYSLIILLAMKVADKETHRVNKKIYLIIVAVSTIILGLLLTVWQNLGNISLIVHKYPPGLYYLSYGLIISSLIILISTLKFFQQGIVNRFIIFTSKESYTLFFVSFIVLDFVQNQREIYPVVNNVVIQLTMNIFISFFIVYLLQLVISICHTPLNKRENFFADAD